MVSDSKTRRQAFREEFEKHLDSPTTLLARLRDLIFGKTAPDMYTKVAFWIAITGWGIFMLWSILGYTALKMQYLIVDNKSVNIDVLIGNRGIELGFDPREFVVQMQQLYGWSIVSFAIVFAGIIFLWRQQFVFVWFFFGGMILYPVVIVMFAGWSYLGSDITAFDKILWFVLVAQTAVYAFFLKRKQNGLDFDFFGLGGGD